jgi:hypothetical protein
VCRRNRLITSGCGSDIGRQQQQSSSSTSTAQQQHWRIRGLSYELDHKETGRNG